MQNCSYANWLKFYHKKFVEQKSCSERIRSEQLFCSTNFLCYANYIVCSGSSDRCASGTAATTAMAGVGRLSTKHAWSIAQQNMSGKAPNKPYPEQRSTGKLAPQRPPSTTLYSILNYPSLTIRSRFNALFALYFLYTSMHLLSTYLEGIFSIPIQSMSSIIEKTVYVVLHKTRKSQSMDFPLCFC